MGADSEIQKENEKLVKEIEKLEEKNNNLEKEINVNKPDLTEDEIENIKNKNKTMKNDLTKLKTDYNNLKNTYNKLIAENNQIKSYCGQLQLMFLMKMQQNNFNSNLSNFSSFQTRANSYQSQINNFVNNNNFNNFGMGGNNLRRCQTRIGENNQNIITLIFNVNNFQKFPIVTLPNYRLGNIFLLLSNQYGNSLPSDINKLKFEYNTIDVTKNFANNDLVSSLNLKSYTPIINVISKN